MQKVVTVTCLGDSDKKPYAFAEVKEVNVLLEQGYKVVSIDCCNPPKQGFYCVFLIVLEK